MHNCTFKTFARRDLKTKLLILKELIVLIIYFFYTLIIAYKLLQIITVLWSNHDGQIYSAHICTPSLGSL